MKIDLCIVSYNCLDKTKRLIESLFTPKNIGYFDLCIFDNSSTDGSAQMLKEYASKYPMKLVCSNKNYGYAAACNRMAQVTSNEIIGLLNCDTWFNDGDIPKLIQSFIDTPEAAVIGPKQRDERGLITHAGIFGTNSAPKHRSWHEPDSGDKLFRDKTECVTVSGSAYFVRRQVWNEALKTSGYLEIFNKYALQTAGILEVPAKSILEFPGVFLPTPHYYEETFASYFLRHLGYKVCYDGSISIGHSWHATHPMGSKMDGMFKISQVMFREACDYFGIERD